MEKDVSWKWEKKKARITIPDKRDFKTKAITQDEEGSSDPMSGYLSEPTQNTALKGHVPSYVHCSIIYN